MKTRVYPTSRKLFGLLGDVTIITLTYILLTYLIIPPSAREIHQALYSGMLPIAVIFSVLLFSINGLYTIEHKRFSEVLISLAVSLFLVLILVMALSFVIHEFAYSRVLIASSTAVQFVLLGFWKRAVQRWEQSLHRPPGHDYGQRRRMPSCLLPHECPASAQAEAPARRHESAEKLAPGTGSCDIDTLIICSDIPITTKADIVNYCTDKEVQPYIIPSSYEIFCNGAMLQKIDDVPVFRPKSLRLSVEQRAVKRTVDIIVAGMAAICALPFAIPVALAIKLGDGGPVLYSQVRVGRFGKEYKVYKFRSMRVDAEKYSGLQLATEDDPRITKVGKFIRATRLDELPQILNVLNDDMSLVGPAQNGLSSSKIQTRKPRIRLSP